MLWVVLGWGPGGRHRADPLPATGVSLGIVLSRELLRPVAVAQVPVVPRIPDGSSRRCCHRESRPSPNLSLARSALIAGRVPRACFPALTKHLCMEDLMPGIKHIIVNLPLIKPN